MIEPTCGSGAFIRGALSLALPPREIQGIEIQERYVAEARACSEQAISSRITVQHRSIFDVNLGADLRWGENGPLLVVGNPPWVTNAELSVLASVNIPRKRNLKHLSGFEAMTGSSNFDVAEYIWLKLLRELMYERPTIALLCKTVVARNVLSYAAANRLPVNNAAIHLIDARYWFHAAVDACLFVVEVGEAGKEERQYEADVYTHLLTATPASRIGVIGGQLVSNVSAQSEFAHLDGLSPLTWRQGIKHDAASVVELTRDRTGNLVNKAGDDVSVESAYIYPLLKSSDIGGKATTKPERAVIVTQRHVGEHTRHLACSAPHLWSYLMAHEEAFRRRKSAIYRRQPQFAYFGIGDYTFAPYKVAISGMYKTPVFRAIGPVNDRPVLLDDTCYFLPCTSSQQAALIACLLNDPHCLGFLQLISFRDAKRPITKKLLQRIDLHAVLRHVDQKALLRRAQAEIERFAGDVAQPVVWPESLETLLSGGDAEPVADTIQLTLLTS